MSNSYKVLLPVLYDGEHKQGDVFEKQFASTEDEEADLRSGLLEIVPRTYKNTGVNEVEGVGPGQTFEAALTMGREQMLIDGGHIERVKEKPAPKQEDKKSTVTKEVK